MLKKTENFSFYRPFHVHMHWKRIDSVFVLFVSVLVFFSILFEFLPEYGTIVQFSTYRQYLTPLTSASLVVFFVCFLGNVLPLPTPYLLITWIASTLYRTENSWVPLWFAVIAALGAVCGEIISYWFGRGVNMVIKTEKMPQIQFFHRLLIAKPTLAPILLYFFGITPISDDVILVPLGLLKYPQKMIFIYCGLGKFSLMLILALMPDLFLNASLDYSFITTMLPLFAIFILMYLLLRIDWVDFIRQSPRIIKFFKLNELLEENLAEFKK